MKNNTEFQELMV